LTTSSVRVLERGSAGWPACLAHLGAAQPKRLHVRGSLSLATACAAPAVAMVGARAPSAAGERFARALARELAEAGVTVISGLALGIDAAAHVGALDGGGDTIAVLGCGIDRDYPRRNAGLAARIAATGAIVSEWGPGVEPAPWRFPARNRIVAGLCAASVVVEAREQRHCRALDARARSFARSEGPVELSVGDSEVTVERRGDSGETLARIPLPATARVALTTLRARPGQCCLRWRRPRRPGKP
jgi:DNA processing protein